ncbi:MAG: hypothetical protein ACYDD5_00840 [Sulfuricurvum sp.]
MIYLLRHNPQEEYVLVNREGTTEYLYNKGEWTPLPPHTAEHLASVETYSVETNSKGETINWWLTKYYDFADATCIKRCKNLDNYKKWILSHPEFFI